MSIREDFLFVLSNYIQSKNNRDMNEVRDAFRRLRAKMEKLAVVRQNNNIIVTFGTGIGNIANVPWIAFLDKRETTTTQRGIYCVYLLKADMSGLYLTINQGVGKTARGSPTKEKLDQLHEMALRLRKEFAWLTTQGFTLAESQLNYDGATGKAYEKSTVAYKYYDLRNIPSGAVLEKDLTVLIDAYEQYVKALGFTASLPNKKLDPIISEETFFREEVIREAQARKISEAELKRRLSAVSGIPSVQRTISVRFVRNPNVAIFVKTRAEGKCKLCKKEAPFKDNAGNPFLEVHHIKWLSHGGKDTVENAVALCPNCHRKIHLLNLAEDIKILRK